MGLSWDEIQRINAARKERRQRGVSAGLDFRRIQDLPRRTWEPSEELAEKLTERLASPVGTMKLFPIQAQALYEINQNGGAFLPIGVGQGKALISLLAPVVLGARKPLLLVPASLREQTTKKVIPEMSLHWKLNLRLNVKGYSELSQAKNADMLHRLMPDVIILDECHKIKSKTSGRTKRLLRYLKDFPETKVVAMSGTITTRSIKEYAHILEWTHGWQNSPLPQNFNSLKDWANAIDEGIPDENRMAPGALEAFCNPGENVREGYQRRLTETPGVVASHKSALGTSLVLKRGSPGKCPLVKKHLLELRNTWTMPDGDEIVEAVDMWRHVREICLGFFYRWDPAGPPDWMEARRNWKKYVRETLRYNKRKLDTELQVWNECERERPVDEFLAWKEIKDTFRPNTVPEWFSDVAINSAAKWLEKNDGICWVEHRAFGERLAEHTGLFYHGAGDETILDAQGPIIASIRAHGTGKNLQRYANSLVVSPPTSGSVWEQLLGRTHRHGQTSDEVSYEMWLHEPELNKGFEQARADALYLKETTGAAQKLLYADYEF